jgi:hypothetical protein
VASLIEEQSYVKKEIKESPKESPKESQKDEDDKKEDEDKNLQESLDPLRSKVMGVIQGQATKIIDKYLAYKNPDLYSEEKRKKIEKDIKSNATSNPSTIIGFSGGGSVYTYQWSGERSVPITLDVDKDFNADWNLHTTIKADAEAVAETENEPDKVFEGDHEVKWGTNRIETYDLTQDLSFSLSDLSPNDLFDVKITRDVVYGTPIFQTLGGRSTCPHELNTDNQDNFQIEFAIHNEEKLDLISATATPKEANASVEGKTRCASVIIVISNGKPGGYHHRRLFVDNIPLGLEFKLNGIPGSLHELIPLKGEGTSQSYTITFCTYDDRFLHKRDGLEGVYRNLNIVVSSACEMDLQPAKMGIKESTANYNECTDGYSIGPNTNCVEFREPFTIQSNITTESSTVEFFEEKVLSSRIILNCLSFSGKCGCDQSECSLATKEVRVQSNITNTSQWQD